MQQLAEGWVGDIAHLIVADLTIDMLAVENMGALSSSLVVEVDLRDSSAILRIPQHDTLIHFSVGILSWIVTEANNEVSERPIVEAIARGGKQLFGWVAEYNMQFVSNLWRRSNKTDL